MVTEYWDAFFEDEFCWPIRGFSFHIDMSSHSDIFCKSPRYSPHKSEVTRMLAERLDKNGMVEEDDGP